jgi:hypothetical protein
MHAEFGFFDQFNPAFAGNYDEVIVYHGKAKNFCEKNQTYFLPEVD